MVELMHTKNFSSQLHGPHFFSKPVKTQDHKAKQDKWTLAQTHTQTYIYVFMDINIQTPTLWMDVCMYVCIYVYIQFIFKNRSTF